MAAQFFPSSYKQYKDDTSVFTTWLGKAAEACGYKAKTKTRLGEVALGEKKAATPAPAPVAPVITPRLKGKARKAAKLAQPKERPELISLNDENVATVKYAVSI
jgi:hypothetical protein